MFFSNTGRIAASATETAPTSQSKSLPHFLHSKLIYNLVSSSLCAAGKGHLISPGTRPKQHFLYFVPLPQGQGSLRPTLPEESDGTAGAVTILGEGPLVTTPIGPEG